MYNDEGIAQWGLIEEFRIGSITFRESPSKIIFFKPKLCVEEAANNAALASTQIVSISFWLQSMSTHK